MLQSLYFGKDDAETDIGSGGLLSAGFLETSAYRFALSGEKWLFLGRKGSGKSAICLKLQKTFGSSGRSSLVTPDEISADEIKRFELGGISPYQAKELLWRYIFCVQLSKLFLRFIKDNQNRSFDTIGLHLRQFLVDNGEVDELTALERFWRIVERLKTSLKISAFKVVEASITVENISSGARLSDQVEVVERKIQEYARTLGINAERNKFYLLIDQIEKIWSNDAGSDTLVIGLLRAGKHAQSAYPFLNCSVFLRIDIYEKLDFKERDKLRSDELFIRWNRDTLIDLIQARAVASMGSALESIELWTKIFPRKIAEVDVRRFLSSRTLNRPRDIIQLCNACRDVARGRGNELISERDVLSAAKQHSRWKLVDIQNEWAVNYPFLSDALLLLSNGSYLFERDEFGRKYSLVAADFSERYPSLRSQLSADYLLSVLFSISVIGVIREHEAEYFCNGEFDEGLAVADRSFAIHPCFREALQCQSAIELPQFEEANIIQLEAVQSRFRRRSSSVGPEEGDSPYGYFAKEFSSRVHSIRREIESLVVPGEVREELRSNLATVDSEIRKIETAYDETETRDTMDRLSVFFKAMERSLRKAQIINEKSDLYYLIREFIESCQEFAYGGRARRYRT